MIKEKSMKIKESIISKALRESINEFLNEDGATACGAMGGGSFAVLLMHKSAQMPHTMYLLEVEARKRVPL